MIEVTLLVYILSFAVLALSMCAAFYGICWGLHWKAAAFRVAEHAEDHAEKISHNYGDLINAVKNYRESGSPEAESYLNLILEEASEGVLCVVEINGEFHACRTDNPMPGDLVGVGATITEAARDLVAQEDQEAA